MTVLERTINPLLFMYLGALYDVFMTIYGMIFWGGEEANPLLNWITPNYMIPITAFVFFIIGMIGIIGLLKILEYISMRYNRNIDRTILWLSRGFIFAGIWHFGTGSTWWF